MKKFPFAVSLSVFLFLAAAEAWANPLTYTIDYRNPSISIPEEKKQAVINQALKSWPNSKIEISWDYVYNSAINHNWNPAFVIALWLEESGASGVSAYDVGCLGGSPNNIPSQLNCLFTRPYANETFRTFMCKYSGEKEECYTNPNYNFSNNPYFPTNLGIWYYRLAGNAGLGGSVGDSGEPTEPGGSFYTEETIFLKDSLASNDLLLDYRYHREESYPTPAPPTPNISPAPKVQGATTELGTKPFDGELNITEEGKNLPNFKIMEETLSFSLERLLPESLRKELSINPQEISGKARHFVYGLSENEGKLAIDSATEEIPREIPEEKAAFPSWWGRLIGESKVVCGLFNTCPAPESLKIKVAAADEYNPPEGLGHRNSSSLVDEEDLDNEVISSRFTIISFFTRIIEEITEFFEYWGEVLIAKKETTTTTALAETRAIVPGGENIRENTSFFKGFLPASAVPAHHNSPLKVSADYEVSSEYTLRGEEKLEYHNLGATQRNYCLSLCSQYPADFNISQIDPLCPSCRPDDYPLEGYGDIPLSRELCQPNAAGGCDYYDPLATEGCGEGQDPVCESGRCNPYELNSDDYNKKCPNGTLEYKKQGCRNPDLCYEMTFAENPAGGFGECQYANPTVCVRADRLEIGKCAAVCNWTCCAEQKKK
jgi:hypothetical protein